MGSAFSSETQNAFDRLARRIQKGETQEVQGFLRKLEAAKAKPDAGCNDEEKILKNLNLNDCAISGKTPLQHAAMCARADIVRLLLQYPAWVDPNTLGDGKHTALHVAAMHVRAPQCGQICQALLMSKADPCIAASDGFTPLDLARKVGCRTCVRTIEDNTKLWQGWVDVYEPPKVLQWAPTWTPKWMVVLQDRRPNTGNTKPGSLSCSNCGHVQPMPSYTTQFACANCRAIVAITPSLQMAFYKPAIPTATMLVPDVALPEQVVRIPQMQNRLEACALDDSGVGNTLKSLFQGKIDSLLQNSVQSERRYGMKVKVLGASSVWQEYSFRLQEESDRTTLIAIMRNPVKAAYDASIESVNRPQILDSTMPVVQATRIPPPPPPSAPLPGAAAWNCAVCTYRHEGDMASLAACTMCDAPRGSEPVQNETRHTPSAPSASIVFAQGSQALQTGPILLEPAPSVPPPAPKSCTTSYALLPQNTTAERVANTTASTSESMPPVETIASSTTPAVPSDPNASSNQTAEDDDSGMCSICLERVADTAIIPCGHQCGCNQCLEGIRASAKPECPMCRGPVSSLLKIYRG